MLNSCEGELDDLGSQLVGANAADGFDKAYSLIAYNIDNNDAVRADAAKLDSVRIGAFDEPVFGAQKASYVTQVRLNQYNPDFGKNPAIDSVVLSLKPMYETAADSITTNPKDDYVYPDGNIPAKKVVTTYPVKKYGKAKIGGKVAPFTIRVNEVTDFLGGISDSLFSDKPVAYNTLLGSKTFNGTINSVKITKDSDNSDIVPEISASLRINLDKDFFQNKIIAKQGNQVLNDAASFIRYFRGIRISVDENDGYLFAMAPNDASITIYYKNDVTASDGTVTKTSAQTVLNLGSSNVHLSQIDYKNRGTGTDYAVAMKTAVNVKNISNPISPSNYATKLYLQGMGGSSIGIRIPSNVIDKLTYMYKTDKTAIVSAKIRLSNDDASWDNSYKKPSNLLVKQNGSAGFLMDMSVLANAGYTLVRPADLSTKNAYYDISITATLKNIVENGASNQDIIIDAARYLTNPSTGLLLGQTYNSKAYSPYRLVFQGVNDVNNVGQDLPLTSKAVQLRLLYTKKQN